MCFDISAVWPLLRDQRTDLSEPTFHAVVRGAGAAALLCKVTCSFPAASMGPSFKRARVSAAHAISAAVESFVRPGINKLSSLGGGGARDGSGAVCPARRITRENRTARSEAEAERKPPRGNAHLFGAGSREISEAETRFAAPSEKKPGEKPGGGRQSRRHRYAARAAGNGKRKSVERQKGDRGKHY